MLIWLKMQKYFLRIRPALVKPSLPSGLFMLCPYLKACWCQRWDSLRNNAAKFLICVSLAVSAKTNITISIAHWVWGLSESLTLSIRYVIVLVLHFLCFGNELVCLWTMWGNPNIQTLDSKMVLVALWSTFIFGSAWYRKITGRDVCIWWDIRFSRTTIQNPPALWQEGLQGKTTHTHRILRSVYQLCLRSSDSFVTLKYMPDQICRSVITLIMS